MAEFDRAAADRHLAELAAFPLDDAGYYALASMTENLFRAALAEIDKLNQMLRDTGYGQGQIDAYVQQCEKVDQLTIENAGLIKAKDLLTAGMGSLTERYDELKHANRRLEADRDAAIEALEALTNNSNNSG